MPATPAPRPALDRLRLRASTVAVGVVPVLIPEALRGREAPFGCGRRGRFIALASNVLFTIGRFIPAVCHGFRQAAAAASAFGQRLSAGARRRTAGRRRPRRAGRGAIPEPPLRRYRPREAADGLLEVDKRFGA